MADWLGKGLTLTTDPAEAVRILLDEALPTLPVISRAEIEKHSAVLGNRSSFESGPRSHMEPLFRTFLNYLRNDPQRRGFKTFRIEVKTWNTQGLDCAIVNADFEPFVTRIPVWREGEDFIVAPRTGDFPRPK